MADKRTLILASDDAFFKAYEDGYIHFVENQKDVPITDDGIYLFFVTTLKNSDHPPRYSAGFIAGWIAALFNKSYRREESVAFTVIQGGRQV